MFEALVQAVQHNPLITGGVLLGAGGSVIATARRAPEHVFEFIKRKLVVTVEIRSTNQLYWWFLEWIDQQEFSRKSRSISASIDYRMSDEHLICTPAPGDHIIKYRGKRIWFNRERRENKAWGQLDETLTLTMLAQDQQVVRDLLNDVENAVRNADRRYIRIWMPSGDGWEELARKAPRSIDSVILDGDEAEKLLDDMRLFYAEADWYAARGLPHRRGYLFYGPPGTGKSSLAHAIGGELKKDIFVVSLVAEDMNDKRLACQLQRIPEDGIALIEDVDAAFDQRTSKREDGGGVTFSGLLNAIDGLAAKDGQVTILSTNHKRRLDPALIRPGRVDYQLHLDNASDDQACRLYKRFFPDALWSDASWFAALAGGRLNSMAALQNHLLKWRRDPTRAIEQVGDLAITA